ncbi:MAG TPA: hypothetical protein VNV16_08210 [Methylibium sp.]|nr:hypothetical protein [Methylibium sp.]
MDTPLTPPTGSSPPLAARPGGEEAAWAALRDELAQLNVQLEYLKLLLKLGVHRL